MKDLLQIKKTRIDAGFDEEYRLFQISDIHMANLNNDSSQMDIEEKIRFHEQWDELKVQFAKAANEFCDERYNVEPNILFEKLADYALSIKANALILSGDIMDRVSESNILYMKKFIENYPIPVIYCLGNHESINENGEEISQYHRLKEIVNKPDFDSFSLKEFDIITVDNGTKNITDKQLDNLRETLEGNRKVLLVLHAPLNMGEFSKQMSDRISPYFLQGVKGDCENAFKFNELLLKNEDKIIAVLAGHVHFFAEAKITERITQYTTSSGLIGAGREIIIK